MTTSVKSKRIAVFEQVDSWFFRESRPHGSFGANALSSVFPPPTRTLMGALRSHIGNHYFTNHPDESWNDLDSIHALSKVIGNADDLGDIQPRGVFLRESEQSYQTTLDSSCCYYLPAPSNVCVKQHMDSNGNEKPYYFSLKLSDKPYHTDAGHIYLPTLPDKVAELDDLKGAKPLQGAWLSTTAWEQVLRGKSSKLSKDENRVKENKDFVKDEYRLGIQVNSKQRSIVEGQLYQTTHLRLDPSLCIVMPLVLQEKLSSQMLDESFSEQSRLVRLGGEGRMANLTIDKSEVLTLPRAPSKLLYKTDNGKMRFIIYLITKLKMSEDQWQPTGFSSIERGWQGDIRGVPIKIVSACMPKAQREGGWDQKKHRPRPIESYLPAGSTFFVEVDSGITSKELIDKLHGKTFFAENKWGEGLMLLGKYRD